jgi:VWFA-related protein
MRICLLKTITIALFWALIFTAGLPIRAQQSDGPRNSVTIPTDLVVTWAHIFNKKDGSVVRGLEADDLLLREDGTPQQISLIKEDQPLSVVILVKAGYCPPDTAPWPAQWSFHRSPEAIGQLGDDTEVALMAWEGDVLLTQPLTRDRQVIADQLSDRNYFKNELYYRKQPQFFENGYRYLPRPGEAVYQAAQYLEGAASPGRRKIIIVLTYDDWSNETHLHTAAEVKELLERTGTTVYGLFQGKEDTPKPTLISKLGLEGQERRRRAGGTIEEFVEQTGGTMLKGMPAEGDESLIKLAGLIRSAYTIGYYPENSEFDGSFRRIKLELSPRGKTKTTGKVNIKTRNGYRALRPSPAAISELPPK